MNLRELILRKVQIHELCTFVELQEYCVRFGRDEVYGDIAFALRAKPNVIFWHRCSQVFADEVARVIDDGRIHLHPIAPRIYLDQCTLKESGPIITFPGLRLLKSPDMADDGISCWAPVALATYPYVRIPV